MSQGRENIMHNVKNTLMVVLLQLGKLRTVQTGTYSLLQVQWCSPPVDREQMHFLLDRKKVHSGN